MADNGNYEEIIGIQLDGGQWGTSLSDVEKQYDDFVARLNSKEVEIAPQIEDTAIRQSIAEIREQISSLADVFKSTLGTGATAAADEVKTSMASIADAASASEKAQTAAVLEGAKQRAAIRAEEAAGAAAMLKEIESAERRATAAGIGGTGGGGLISRASTRRSMREDISGGLSGMLSGLGDSVAMVTEYLLLWKAVQVVIDAVADVLKAPFIAIKDGVTFLAKFQESASQLSANLLSHGIFSKEPAENLKLAQTAADGLLHKLYEISAQLGVDPAKLQTAFEMFSSYGGANLTHNLGDAAQLSGYAFAALQSQNPQIMQRQVATLMQKLVSGTLKDSDKLPAAFGLSAAQLNKMAESARTTHDLLQQIMAAAPGLTERFTSADQRFDALVQKLKTFADILEGEFATPFFDDLIKVMRSVSEWLETNKGNLDAFTQAAGAEIGGVAKNLADVITHSGLSTFFREALVEVVDLIGAVNILLGLMRSADGNNDNAISPLDVLKGKASWGQWWQNRKDNDFGFKPLADAYNQSGKDDEAAQNALFGPHQDSKGGLFGETAEAINKALASYKPNAINSGNPETVGQQSSRLREAYQAEVKDITTAGAEFRKQVLEDVKAGNVTLENATKERATSLDNQAKEIEAAGKRYLEAVRSIHGKSATAAQTKAADTVRANDTKALNDDINQKRSDLDKLNSLNEEIEQAKARADESLSRAAIEHSDSIIDQQRQHGIISPEVAVTRKYQNTSLDIASQLDALQQQIGTITGNDANSVKRRADLANQQTALQQRQQFATVDYKEQAADFPEQERERSEQNQVDRDKERTQELEQRQQLELASHVASNPADIHQDAANVLQSRLQENADETRVLTDKLDSLISAIVDANPGDATNAVKKNPQVNALQLKLASLAVDRQVVQQQEIREQDAAKLGNQAAAAFFGGQSGQEHWDNLTDASHSLSSAANNISQGVGAVFQGYQQGGIGGAVGAGLQTVGQFVPGPAGAVISAVGSLTSMFSGLFSAAAQEIGREVAKAVDKIMEKYSTGQIPLVQAIQQVQEEINHLISSESGRKGGQQVIDNELPQLQQTLDSLKYQQQQEKFNFQDITLEASSTNSVTQQWLTDWVNINKQVEEYQKAVGSAGDAQITQYLNEEMAQQQLNLQKQYNQGQTTAINDALQLNQLLQQRNNYEDEYRKQQFQILSSDSLQRIGNPAQEAAQKLSLAKKQYDQQTEQLNFQVSMTQQKVDLEKQIFGLASDTATLQEQALKAQNFELQQQMAQYEAIANLLAETSGAVYSNGSWNIPSGITTGSGGPFGIPGTGNGGVVNSTDNSVNGQSITVNVTAPSGTDPDQFGSQIVRAIQYKLRTGTAA